MLLPSHGHEQRGAKKAMSSSSSSGAVTIIAVTQCRELWGDDDTRKVRLTGLSSSFTGPQLQRELLNQVYAETKITTGEMPEFFLSQEKLLVEIYDGEHDKFVSLSEYDNTEDLAPRHGRFLRCNILVPVAKNTATLKEPPLAIMGRYFPFDPREPMAYCGSKIVIQEYANNLQEDGTGLVVCE